MGDKRIFSWLVVIGLILVLVYVFYIKSKQSEPANPAMETATPVKPPYDTIIDLGEYQSYFNYKLKDPVFVKYRLYHAGGNYSRKNFKFKNDAPIDAATPDDFAGSGYDEGHLCDAKDFAFSEESEEVTFRFYNCLPQTPNLNRGIWKHWETLIRKESETDSLIVIAGGIFGDKTIGTDQIAVPDKCWKVVQSATTLEIMEVIECLNIEQDATCETITLPVLQKELHYTLPVKE